LEKSQEQETPVSAASSDAAKPVVNLHCKQRGELAELAFMFKAINMGFGVAKPWGDSERYDFILNAGRVHWRVQVKSIWVKRCYTVKTSGHSCVPLPRRRLIFWFSSLFPRTRGMSSQPS
jgi:PD-(D/E)XK endonuclease